MKRGKSFGLFYTILIYTSLSIIISLSAFLIIFDIFNLDEKFQFEVITTISWTIRFLTILTIVLSTAGIVSICIEIKKEKGKKLYNKLISICIALSFFVLIVIYYSTGNHEKNSYYPARNVIYSYEDIRIKLPCGDILAGSLTYPKVIKGKTPAVILINGSSPHDRDNSSPEEPRTAYRPFRQIADRLSSNGIAVLRMDHRGIGESVGGDIRNMTTEERAMDIKECINYIRKRTEFDSLRVGLIGLSEGVSISHMIASHDTLIKALVFLSGIGSSGKDVLEFQIQQDVLKKDQLSNLLNEDRNIRFLYEFDPLRTASKVRQPVLIIHGTSDRFVPYTDAYKLGKAITSNGNKKVTVNVLDGYDHTLLKVDPNGKISSAKIPDEILTIISDWILKEI